MDVEPFGEGLAQLRDVGDMGEHAQFDLAVIGADQFRALGRDEGGADAPALLGPDRYVLQIGIGRGEPPGRGRGERIGGVDAPRIWIDEGGERVCIGRAQFGELAPVEHLAGKLDALARQVLQHI